WWSGHASVTSGEMGSGDPTTSWDGPDARSGRAASADRRGAGVAGYAMRGLGLSPAPLVLGLVLGPLLERSLLQALTIGRGDVRELWSSGPAAVMLGAALVAFVAPAVSALVRLAAPRSSRAAPLAH